MALRNRAAGLVSSLLSRHAGWGLCSSRGMAGGHDLHAAFTPLQQQVRAAAQGAHCRRRHLPPGATLEGQALAGQTLAGTSYRLATLLPCCTASHAPRQPAALLAVVQPALQTRAPLASAAAPGTRLS